MVDLGSRNFSKALEQLRIFCSEPVRTDRDRAGIIQAFEFTFEQSWKAIQKKARSQGVDTPSPKQAYMFALQNHWIPQDKEPQWIEMIQDRNMTSHTYQADKAAEIATKVTAKYLAMFESLLLNMK